MSKTLPFAVTHHVRDNCLCLHAQRAARALARHYDQALRPVGLTSGQFSLLMALNRPQPAGLGQVAPLLAMDRTTLTANLKPLKRDGLVELRTSDADRRARLLLLTPAGRTRLAEALPIWQRVHARLEGLLGATAPDSVRAALNVLASA